MSIASLGRLRVSYFETIFLADDKRLELDSRAIVHIRDQAIDFPRWPLSRSLFGSRLVRFSRSAASAFTSPSTTNNRQFSALLVELIKGAGFALSDEIIFFLLLFFFTLDS